MACAAWRRRRSRGGLPAGLLLECARQEAADQVGLRGDVDQKRVVAGVGGQLAIRHVEIAAPKRAYDFDRLVARIEPVRTEADDQEPGLDLLERRGERAAF